ncbi:hypothetical protein JOB18_002386 [Solea senegalensis]|uniref:Uncharacterized protein n=1 Tax=Solea senegalensis TaxID=28829 RepID=A0AAV6R393_SOLSE|nr:hypothetical protein JOB18_002386 [Solea senegalensis]
MEAEPTPGFRALPSRMDDVNNRRVSWSDADHQLTHPARKCYHRTILYPPPPPPSSMVRTLKCPLVTDVYIYLKIAIWRCGSSVRSEVTLSCRVALQQLEGALTELTMLQVFHLWFEHDTLLFVMKQIVKYCRHRIEPFIKTKQNLKVPSSSATDLDAFGEVLLDKCFSRGFYSHTKTPELDFTLLCQHVFSGVAPGAGGRDLRREHGRTNRGEQLCLYALTTVCPWSLIAAASVGAASDSRSGMIFMNNKLFLSHETSGLVRPVTSD